MGNYAYDFESGKMTQTVGGLVTMGNYAYDFESQQFAAILKQLEPVKPVLVFGVSEKKSGKYFNSAVVVNRGKIIGVYRKTHLIDPNEAFFTPGKSYPRSLAGH